MVSCALVAGRLGSLDRTRPVPVAGVETKSHELLLDAVGADGVGEAAESSSSASRSTVGDHEDDDADEEVCGCTSWDCTCCSSSRMLSRISMAFLLLSNSGLCSL